jgi:hypothetical protein
MFRPKHKVIPTLKLTDPNNVSEPVLLSHQIAINAAQEGRLHGDVIQTNTISHSTTPHNAPKTTEPSVVYNLIDEASDNGGGSVPVSSKEDDQIRGHASKKRDTTEANLSGDEVTTARSSPHASRSSSDPSSSDESATQPQKPSKKKGIVSTITFTNARLIIYF